MDFLSLTDEQILAVADPMMDNLMDASTLIDHARHVQDFTPRLKRIVTSPYLEEVCKAYQAERGLFAKRELVTIMRRPDSAAIVWRQGFTVAQGDYLAEMILVHVDGEFMIDHVAVL